MTWRPDRTTGCANSPPSRLTRTSPYCPPTHDEPADQVAAGAALERVLLTATREGVSASFLNQPLEFEDLRRKVQRLTAAAGTRPHDHPLRSQPGPAPAPPAGRSPTSFHQGAVMTTTLQQEIERWEADLAAHRGEQRLRQLVPRGTPLRRSAAHDHRLPRPHPADASRASSRTTRSSPTRSSTSSTTSKTSATTSTEPSTHPPPTSRSPRAIAALRALSRVALRFEDTVQNA